MLIKENEVQSINTKEEIENRINTGGDLYAINRGWKFTYIPYDENDNLPPDYKTYLSKFI